MSEFVCFEPIPLPQKVKHINCMVAFFYLQSGLAELNVQYAQLSNHFFEPQGIEIEHFCRHFLGLKVISAFLPPLDNDIFITGEKMALTQKYYFENVSSNFHSKTNINHFQFVPTFGALHF